MGRRCGEVHDNGFSKYSSKLWFMSGMTFGSLGFDWLSCRWAMEITEQGTFSAALLPEVAAVNLGGLPVPVLILYNKASLILPRLPALPVPSFFIPEKPWLFLLVAYPALPFCSW